VSAAAWSGGTAAGSRNASVANAATPSAKPEACAGVVRMAGLPRRYPMSDHIQHLIDLSTNVEAAGSAAGALRQWLLATEVIGNSPDGHGHYLPGPRWATAVSAIDEGAPFGVVEIHVGRQRYDAGEAWQPLECASCGHSRSIDSAEDVDAVLEQLSEFGRAWWRTGEPTVACGACGNAQLLGDWPGVSTAVGNLAVSFVNWPGPLTDEFVDTVRARLGARMLVVDERL
jgi:hypothetical protein